MRLTERKMCFPRCDKQGNLTKVDYIEIKDDYSDLEEKLEYYIKHTDEALEIIHNAHKFIDEFKDPIKEAIENAPLKQPIKKKQLEQYESITDFVYKKMTFAGGLLDRNAHLTDTDLRILKKLIKEEQEARKKK